MENLCMNCKICNGKACRNTIPGPGSKGVGDTAIRNYDKWQEIRVNMDTLTEKRPVSTEIEMFGHKFSAPLFAGPVGSVKMHYGDKYSDEEYNDILIGACKAKGIMAFTGDGVNNDVIKAAAESIKKAGGYGVPTIKPWNKEIIDEKLNQLRPAEPIAVAMDVDGAGLPFLKGMNPPAGSKSVEELAAIIRDAKLPFIVKGIMTAKGAKKAYEAGASAIIVSNHGGRVLDQCPATAEVLDEIVRAVAGKMKIIVDGGLRTGTDIFKAIAMGADAVMMARPFVNAAYAGGAEGLGSFITRIISELEDTMEMCGAYSIEEITADMIRR